MSESLFDGIRLDRIRRQVMSNEEAAHAADDVLRLLSALHGCIPWVASSGRGAAQEALAIACDLVGSDPYDWSSHPDVLTARRELLGMPDRRGE